MLYLMHVDWKWIRQRPHFLAEELADSMRVDVAYLLAYRRHNLVQNPRERVRCLPLFRLPSQLTEFGQLARTDQMLLEWQLGRLLSRSTYDYVWLCSPLFFPAVRRHVGTARLIYDCMDDCVEIAHSDRSRILVERCERELLNAADAVLVSSARLAETMKRRGYGRTPVLINNGLSDRFARMNAPPRGQRRQGEPFRLLYFGTIGRWFDVASIEELLRCMPDVVLRVAGPREVALPNHPRIEYLGVVRHEALVNLATDCDALIMPFVVNELIRAVDPVKVYEYIALKRNIIVPDYPEIRKFDKFVSTYTSARGLVAAVSALKRDNTLRYTPESATAFLQEHTWSRRAQQALEAMGFERRAERCI